MKKYTCLYLIVLSISLLTACKKDAPDFNDPNNYIGGVITGPGGVTGGTGNTGSTGGTGGSGVTTAPAIDDSGTPGVYYLKGTLNGKAIDWEETATNAGWVVGDIALTATGSDNFEIGSIGGLLTDTDPHTPSIDIEFGAVHYLDSGDKVAYFNNFFGSSAIGTWGYATGFTNASIKGVNITYDIDDDSYTTQDGSQSGSTFKVLSIEQRGSAISNQSVKIKVQFSCTLYDVNKKLSPITLTNAEAVIRITNSL